MRAVIVGVLVLASTVLAACENEQAASEAAYLEGLVEVIGTVNEAGLPFARAFLDASACETEEQCADAMTTLVAEARVYDPIVRRQVAILEDMEVPDAYTDYHRAYTEQLELRIDGGEMIIEGWESLDEDMVLRGIEKYYEAQAKLAEILDALEPLLEGE